MITCRRLSCHFRDFHLLRYVSTLMLWMTTEWPCNHSLIVSFFVSLNSRGLSKVKTFSSYCFCAACFFTGISGFVDGTSGRFGSCSCLCPQWMQKISYTEICSWQFGQILYCCPPHLKQNLLFFWKVFPTFVTIHFFPPWQLPRLKPWAFCYEFYNILQYSCYNHFNAAGSKRQEKRPDKPSLFWMKSTTWHTAFLLLLQFLRL